eukprot:TRINITY_DN19842_c0_g1_i1.p1 TRINITY_DN19842_c0_g1~~TRINITY_DN19842_c0_g1_i1.p1  ORF type:complete len:304 (-),score=8.11 TRINITY_DN19842_c0_g1_i1:46-831(-)
MAQTGTPPHKLFQLPHVVLLEICLFLPALDVARHLTRVSTEFFRCTSDDFLWRKFYLRHWLILCNHGHHVWRGKYRARHRYLRMGYRHHCSACGCTKSFLSRAKLDNHTKTEHAASLSSDTPQSNSKSKRLVCSVPYCDYVAYREVAFLEHARQVHQISRPFCCSYPSCSYTTTSQNLLTKHSKRHQTTSQYMCPKKGCRQLFDTVESIQDHFAEQHEKDVKKLRICQIPDCTRVFVSNPSWIQHQQSHTNNTCTEGSVTT